MTTTTHQLTNFAKLLSNLTVFIVYRPTNFPFDIIKFTSICLSVCLSESSDEPTGPQTSFVAISTSFWTRSEQIWRKTYNLIRDSHNEYNYDILCSNHFCKTQHFHVCLLLLLFFARPFNSYERKLNEASPWWYFLNWHKPYFPSGVEFRVEMFHQTTP